MLLFIGIIKITLELASMNKIIMQTTQNLI